jgi:hypothetical protein
MYVRIGHLDGGVDVVFSCWGKYVNVTRGADKSLALERKQQPTGLKEYIYST